VTDKTQWKDDILKKFRANRELSPHGLTFDEIQEAYYSFFSPDAQTEFDWVQRRDVMRDKGEAQPPIEELVKDGWYKWRHSEPVPPNDLRARKLKL